MLNDKPIKFCLSRFDSGAYSHLQVSACSQPFCRLSYGVPTAAGRRQQQQQQQRAERRGKAGARAGSDNFRGVGIGNGSRGNNLGRLLRRVPSGATCWLRIGAVRICVVLRSVCYACVSYGWGCPVCRADITMVMRIL